MRMNNMNLFLKMLTVTTVLVVTIGCSEKDTLEKARNNLDEAFNKVYLCGINKAKKSAEWESICSAEIKLFNQANFHFKNNYTTEYMLDKQLLEDKLNLYQKERSNCTMKAWTERTDKNICFEVSEDEDRLDMEYHLKFNS